VCSLSLFLSLPCITFSITRNNNIQPSLLVTFKKFGIGVKFVTETDPKAFAAAIDDKTKAVYVESIGNPKYNVSDIPALAKVCFFPNSTVHISQACSTYNVDNVITQVAHDHGIPLIVDNTFGMGGTCILRGYLVSHTYHANGQDTSPDPSNMAQTSSVGTHSEKLLP